MANSPVPRTNPEFGMADLAGITVSKIASERLLAMVPFVGNGSYRSGVMKLGGASVIYGTTRNAGKNVKRGANWVSTGMAVDGAEDVVSRALKQFGLISSGEQQQTQNQTQVI